MHKIDTTDIGSAIGDHLTFTLGKRPETETVHDVYMALCYAIRDRMMAFYHSNSKPNKTVAYLSAEFLIGPQLANNLLNLGLREVAAEAVEEYGYSIDEILEQAEEPGLGNGGLGRLAACYMESLSTLKVPATGYGIRYKFGIFKQRIHNNQQIEVTDNWLHGDWPWEVCYPDQSVKVGFGGRVEHYTSNSGDNKKRVRWVPDEHVFAVPYDVLQVGYDVDGCNKLRLWRADACDVFDFGAFNEGDYLGSVEKCVFTETISKVLYPNDGTCQGKTLRLKQQFFFVSASLQDMIRTLKENQIPLEKFHEHYQVQLNDTHPAVAVAELMRLLVDDNRLDWDLAWDITTKSIAYTNHTLLPEALEKWDLQMFGSLLPRHLEIIYDINHRFLQIVRMRYPGNDEILRKLSIIDENGNRSVRMANLATVGSHHVNGVAALHSELITKNLMPEFYDLWPHKFTNVTNGVTPRRWLASSNIPLAEVITSYIGSDWITNMSKLQGLEDGLEDASLLEKIAETKILGKYRLAQHIQNSVGVVVDPSSIFDVQVKRIHEYKRQHLLALWVVSRYIYIKNHKDDYVVPRTVIFGGKAAPGYWMAKLIIRFICSIAETINSDPDMDGKLKVIFLPNYSVKLGEKVYPAADLSEQISTAGKEASGTGNMKFQMNGALTIGTLDGANVEIRDLVGEENFFLFGRTETEIADLWANGYDPKYFMSGGLFESIELIKSGHFSGGDREIFKPLIDNITKYDPFSVCADFEDYNRAQSVVDTTWGNRREWSRKSLINIARSGFFSSDRSIQDYCDLIWKI